MRVRMEVARGAVWLQETGELLGPGALDGLGDQESAVRLNLDVCLEVVDTLVGGEGRTRRQDHP
jgi:hypothetical protein